MRKRTKKRSQDHWMNFVYGVENWLGIPNRSWSLNPRAANPSDLQLLRQPPSSSPLPDGATGHRVPILAVPSDPVRTQLPNELNSLPLNLQVVTPRNTVPPRGDGGSVPNYHVVPLSGDIGKMVALHESRGQDEHDNPKHHVTHQAMLFRAPELIIQHLWDVFKRGGGYVVWSYTDFYNHFTTWKGSYVDLLTDVRFMWRSFVTVLLTITLVEILPLIEGLGRLLWDIFEVIRSAFGLVERAVEELFLFLSIIWNDTEALVRRWIG